MNAARKICIVTGSRAEYGLLYWLIKSVDDDPELQLQMIATGMHLSPEFGLTYKQIEADGFQIDDKVEMLLSSDSTVAVTKSIGLGCIGFAEAYDKLKPDMVVVLGDRFEILAAAQAAMLARIPIAHIHGGETSEGAFDEGIRHAITKMSHWHFVAAEPYRKRVIQMGEVPDRVFNVGSPGLDHLKSLRWLSKSDLEKEFQLKLEAPLFLVTYHPVTLSDKSPVECQKELLDALEQFPDATIIFTYPNADTGGRLLIEDIDKFVTKQCHSTKAFISLGQQRYLSLMKLADVVIGNSSSGLTEAPALKKATVNIGDRQKGRLKASSIIDSDENKEKIISAIQLALSDEFRQKLPDTVSLYGLGDASVAIANQLKTRLPMIQKTFFDIDYEC